MPAPNWKKKPLEALIEYKQFYQRNRRQIRHGYW